LLLELSSKYTNWNTNAGTDKSWPHSYIQNVYEKELAPYQHSDINLLEIGVSGGYSLKVWSEYFSKAMIYGLDINLHAYNVYPIPENVRFVVGDGTKSPAFDTLPKFTIIIDDGSHYLHDQIETFKIAFPLLESGGLFIIEDIQDLDEARTAFEAINPDFEIFDLREKSGRTDDIIFLYRS
jgi:hypothetical protein